MRMTPQSCLPAQACIVVGLQPQADGLESTFVCERSQDCVEHITECMLDAALLLDVLPDGLQRVQAIEGGQRIGHVCTVLHRHLHTMHPRTELRNRLVSGHLVSVELLFQKLLELLGDADQLGSATGPRSNVQF
jgi:Asp-tRNA(Asn)/Glu-tRNA(Gln) amidotransferase A subunit family amidase